MRVRQTGCLLDGTTRLTLEGRPLKHFCGVASFADHAVVPERGVLRIPEDLPLDRAALLGCAMVSGVGAVVNAARVRPGSSVAVFGTGGVGLCVVQGAAPAGAARIFAVDRHAPKLELARRFGATDTVDASAADPVAAVRAATGGRGVDYAFEGIGEPRAERGVAVVLGVAPTTAEVSVPVLSLVFEERVLTGSIYGAGAPRVDIPRLIELYRAGKLELDEVRERPHPLR